MRNNGKLHESSDSFSILVLQSGKENIIRKNSSIWPTIKTCFFPHHFFPFLQLFVGPLPKASDLVKNGTRTRSTQTKQTNNLAAMFFEEFFSSVLIDFSSAVVLECFFNDTKRLGLNRQLLLAIERTQLTFVEDV